MQHLSDYLEHLKRKSAPERRQVALTAASAFIALVALGYVGVLTSSGTLALNSAAAPVAADHTSASDLLGAAAAFRAEMEEGDLTVVESTSSSTFQEEPTSATVIPF